VIFETYTKIINTTNRFISHGENLIHLLCKNWCKQVYINVKMAKAH